MNDPLTDSYGELQSYLQSVHPYVTALQQAYDQLVDLGLAPAMNPMTAWVEPSAAAHSHQDTLPSPRAQHTHPGPTDGVVSSPAADTDLGGSPPPDPGGPPLGSQPPGGVHAISAPFLGGSYAKSSGGFQALSPAHPAGAATVNMPPPPKSQTTSNPFEKSMWPSHLPTRIESLPLNSPGLDSAPPAQAVGRPQPSALHYVSPPQTFAPLHQQAHPASKNTTNLMHMHQPGGDDDDDDDGMVALPPPDGGTSAAVQLRGPREGS